MTDYDGPEWLNINYSQNLRHGRSPTWTPYHQAQLKRYMLGHITAATAAANCQCGAVQLRCRAELAMRVAARG